MKASTRKARLKTLERLANQFPIYFGYAYFKEMDHAEAEGTNYQPRFYNPSSGGDEEAQPQEEGERKATNRSSGSSRKRLIAGASKREAQGGSQAPLSAFVSRGSTIYRHSSPKGNSTDSP